MNFDADAQLLTLACRRSALPQAFRLRSLPLATCAHRSILRCVNESPYPRPPTSREREVLAYLLAVDFPGVEALREQAAVASVTARCPCGCASIDISVAPNSASHAVTTEPIPVEAQTREDYGGETLSLLLFVRDGWMEGLEIVYYGRLHPVRVSSLNGLRASNSSLTVTPDPSFTGSVRRPSCGLACGSAPRRGKVTSGTPRRRGRSALASQPSPSPAASERAFETAEDE